MRWDFAPMESSPPGAVTRRAPSARAPASTRRPPRRTTSRPSPASRPAAAWSSRRCATAASSRGAASTPAVERRRHRRRLQGSTNVIDVKLSVDAGLALRSDGTVWSWGRMFFSNPQYNGAPGRSGSAAAAPIPGTASIVAIAAGYNHALMLGADGRVWAFGANAEGQLGDGTTTSTNAFKPGAGPRRHRARSPPADRLPSRSLATGASSPGARPVSIPFSATARLRIARRPRPSPTSTP